VLVAIAVLVLVAIAVLVLVTTAVLVVVELEDFGRVTRYTAAPATTSMTITRIPMTTVLIALRSFTSILYFRRDYDGLFRI
jgi:hypothetical protein